MVGAFVTGDLEGTEEGSAEHAGTRMLAAQLDVKPRTSLIVIVISAIMSTAMLVYSSTSKPSKTYSMGLPIDPLSIALIKS